MDLFRQSSLGQFQPLLSVVQSSSKTPNRNLQNQLDPKETMRLCQSTTKASRSSLNITRRFLVLISLLRHQDQLTTFISRSVAGPALLCPHPLGWLSSNLASVTRAKPTALTRKDPGPTYLLL